MLNKELEFLVLKEKDIIPFLKSLNEEDKKKLLPFLKKFRTKIHAFKEVKGSEKWGYTQYTFKHIYSEKCRDLVDKACFVCFGKKEIKNIFIAQKAVSEDYLKTIIPWYTPSWYSDYINEEMPWGLSYEKLMALQRKGLLQASTALILSKLPDALVESRSEGKKHVSYYKPEKLLMYPETLAEHIWLLFEEESTINNYYNYLQLKNYSGGNDVWIDALLNLSNSGKINRQKLLLACLNTSTMGFNKNLSGWFFNLLVKLDPSPEEVLSFQDAFFTALQSPHSKIVNTVLKYFKGIAIEETFQQDAFVDQASILLSSEVKSILNSTLMILDKIAKVNEDLRAGICVKATEAFLSLDEKLQNRAAKLIVKYVDISEDISQELAMYEANLLHSSKELLKEFLPKEEQEEDLDCPQENVDLLSTENKIRRVETLDDLIFFVSQSIDNNQVYDIDLLLTYLPKLNALINEEQVSKLEAIFKRAFDLSISYEYSSSIGALELDVAFYLNDFASILAERYPDQLKDYKRYKSERIQELKANRFYNAHFKDRVGELEKLPVFKYVYNIHRNLFLHSKSLLRKGLTLDLLSTPTHAPCWLDARTLIERIIAYEQQGITMMFFDFQVALGRLVYTYDYGELKSSIERISDQQIRQVLRYHLDDLPLAEVDIKRPELWLQSVLSKNIPEDIDCFEVATGYALKREMGHYDWDIKLNEYTYNDYDPLKGKHFKNTMTRRELTFFHYGRPVEGNRSLLAHIRGVFDKKRSADSIESIYSFMLIKNEQYQHAIMPNDALRFLMLSPNNPALFLGYMVKNNLKESTFYSEIDKKLTINSLKGLFELWYRGDFKENTYLFLATSFLCSDKVARTLAAEIWLKAINMGTMNIDLLGSLLGKLEAKDYAPLKRFTDLLSTNMMKLSKQHDECLFRLLHAMLAQLSDRPARGLPRLLEIYWELSATVSDSLPPGELRGQLEGWKQSKSLKSICLKIEKKLKEGQRIK